MKRTIIAILSIAFLLAACGPKPAYKTRDGKKKLKKYNDIQYDGGQPYRSNKRH
jgi:hypothetical protein